MSDGKFIIAVPETISISTDAVRRLVGSGDGDAALLYLYILRAGGKFDREDAAERMGKVPETVDKALAALKKLGLLGDAPDAAEKVRPAPADELPQYTAEDIRREMNEGSEFKALASEVQQALGKMLSSDDLMKLFGIYDCLGLPVEVILQLVMHCKETCARKNGPGRIPTLRYIEKAAYTWEREGIFSLDAAEAYIKRLETMKESRRLFASVMGLGPRSVSPTECRYLDSWADMGFGEDAVAIAYDRTVIKTGKLSWQYMNTIMESWHKKGLHTRSQIETGDKPNTRKTPEKTQNDASAAATAQELDRMKKTLQRIKGD